MGVIEQEYKELRQLLKDYRSGAATEEQVRTQCTIFSQLEKRQKNAISIQALAVKANNQKPVKALKTQGFIGNKTTIDLSIEERESETIRCPISDSIITRATCLDYSGKHLDECESCNQFSITRKLLLEGEGQIFIKKIA